MNKKTDAGLIGVARRKLDSVVSHFDELQRRLEGYELHGCTVGRGANPYGVKLVIRHPDAITAGHVDPSIDSLIMEELRIQTRFGGMSELSDNLDMAVLQLKATTSVAEALRLAVEVSKMIQRETTKETP